MVLGAITGGCLLLFSTQSGSREKGKQLKLSYSGESLWFFPLISSFIFKNCVFYRNSFNRVPHT